MIHLKNNCKIKRNHGCVDKFNAQEAAFTAKQTGS
jgi:hypothetical protein